MSLSREVQFFDAAKKGELATLKSLIEADATLVHYKDGYDRTALFHAAWNNHPEVVAFLMQKGADINIKAYHDTTPISAAADYGHFEAVSSLIKLNADINEINDDGKTPLIRAVPGRYHSTIKALVEHNADLNTQDEEGKTALMHAKDKETFAFLLEAKADIELKDKEGQTVLLKLCADDSNESLITIQNLLSKNVNVNAIDLNGHSAIDCILNGQAPDKLALEKIKLILATAKVNPDFITRIFSTALTLKPAPRLQLLKQFECKPQFKSRLELLTYGYNTNTFDEYYASLSTLEAKEDIAERDAFSRLLIKAIYDEKFDIASRLIKFSNLKIQDEKGKSILELALKGKSQYSENLLNLGKEVINALEDIEQVNEKGESLLMRIIDHSPFVVYLIEKGANLKVISENGDTPLIRATIKCNAKVVKAILNKHAENIDEKNGGNQTALMIAGFRLYCYEYKYADVIQHLLTAKANPNIECTVGWERKTSVKELTCFTLKELVNTYAARQFLFSQPTALPEKDGVEMKSDLLVTEKPVVVEHAAPAETKSPEPEKMEAVLVADVSENEDDPDFFAKSELNNEDGFEVVIPADAVAPSSWFNLFQYKSSKKPDVPEDSPTHVARI